MLKVLTPALIERHVRETPSSLPRIEWLQCQEPLTWTARRREAQVFSDHAEADALARVLSTAETPVFAPQTRTATELAATVPCRYRRQNEIHDWREEAANSGVL